MSNIPSSAPAASVLLQDYLDRLLTDVDGAGEGVGTAITVSREPAGAASTESDQHVADSVNDEPPEQEAWREQAFQALLFRVRNVQFAVPLVRLNGVIGWSKGVAALPNTPDWFLGLLDYQRRKVRVVDTAALAFEGQCFDGAAAPQHIVLFDEGRWGLTCDGISEVVSLLPSDVKWRAGAGKRRWLAGTVRERLCAVLDLDAFAEMLAARGRRDAKGQLA